MLAVYLATGIIGEGDVPPPDPGEDFAAFIAVFPMFAGINEAAFDFWYAQALLVTAPQEACLGGRYQLATWLLTAHYLTLAGLGTGAEAEVAAQGMSGFKSIKSGSLSLDRGDASSTSGGEYATTSFGRRFWPMFSVCIVGPRVTSTGSLMGCGGYHSGPFPWQ